MARVTVRLWCKGIGWRIGWFGDPHKGVSLAHRHRDGAGGLCLAAAAVVTGALPAACLTDITSNNVLMTGFWAWLTAQTLKVP